jgi:hypothetical protein
VSILIPRTARSRRELTYARLLWRVHPDRTMANAFEGPLLKPGALVDDCALWPDERFPAKPILLEFAGNDHSGRGHNRSNDIYILWRFEPDEWAWVEIVRVLTQGADWIANLLPIARAELGGVRAPDPLLAAEVAGRWLSQLDLELKALGAGDRGLALNLIFEQVTARMVGH